MSITFGLPKRVVENKEKYPELPVITMEAVKGLGSNRRFVLNKKAIELLDLIPGIHNVIFAFDGEDNAYISKNNTEDSMLLGKNMAFSNKKYYEHIAKIYKLNQAEDNDFELADEIPVVDTFVYRMRHISSKDMFLGEGIPVTDSDVKDLVEAEKAFIEELVDESTGEVIEAGKEEFLMNTF